MGISCSSESPVEFSYPSPTSSQYSYPQPRPGFVSVDLQSTPTSIHKSLDLKVVEY